ncbi:MULTISPECIES: YigZ family protein [Veillonella]|jgi:YigZ family protein|uniref:YigZ family protein n=1 Tax=Veillonella tobetsuensis TaxID=1110546 RepID=A0A2S7ZRL2_9FIRM|nr:MULTISPECIES: YigZ family protein [Veillonella]MDU5085198.1 YigZ family protein [Veillonella sp.]PQL25901.1 YigZ family protein [Veillonella tobetsuensis]GCL68635.1 YigZ family protein [Veillonella tobetsuensis]
MPETPSPTVEFISIANEFRHEYVVEKSRFITTVYPCSTEEEAQAFIGRINKEFWDARHNCTAFALGPKQEQQRSSDNGEPSGTAGKPMLEVLKKTGITNIAVVVTRYFGGIKLGAGGLIRAYSHSVAETLRLAPKELHTIRTELQTTIDYALYGAVERHLQDAQLHYEASFGEQITLTILVVPNDVERIQKELQDMSHGAATCNVLDAIEVVLPLD